MMVEIDLTALIVSMTLLAGLLGGIMLAKRSSRRKSWIEEIGLHFNLKSEKRGEILAREDLNS